MKLPIALMMAMMMQGGQEKRPVHSINPNWDYVHTHPDCKIVGDPYPPSRRQVMVDGKVMWAGDPYGWAIYDCSGVSVVVDFDRRGRPDTTPDPKEERK